MGGPKGANTKVFEEVQNLLGDFLFLSNGIIIAKPKIESRKIELSKLC